MSFLDKLFALIPFQKKDKAVEHFFALNITTEKLTAALWAIERKQLKILGLACENYSSLEDLTQLTDKLLDESLGLKEIEPQKILFGVPSPWLSNGDLKDQYLKIIRGLVKELELTPMAYVESAQALVHFLEKQEGVPPTAVLVGSDGLHLIVTVVRAGKIDGVKIVSKAEKSGVDIEKGLLTFVDVETLPSKILLYGQEKETLEKLRNQLLAFSWMSKLSFLHFPKIEILQNDVEIKSVCLAGASEIETDVSYTESTIKQNLVKPSLIAKAETAKEVQVSEDLGFVVGDVAAETKEEEEDQVLPEEDKGEFSEETTEDELVPAKTSLSELEDFEQKPSNSAPPIPTEAKSKFSFKGMAFLLGFVGIVLIILGAYLFLLKAEVKIFVEPKILDKDAQVTADPNQKTVDEDSKIIPGQLVDTEVSGSNKAQASGKKQIGDAAKGTVVIRNKTDEAIALSKGTILGSSNGLKFSLDLSVNIASRSADDGTWGKVTAPVTARNIGADGNLPSGSDMTVSGFSQDKLVVKAEGNFSGGTSKDVTVVSSDDQQKLLASLSSSLRQQAQQKLQEKLPQRKILEEGLSEDIIKKSFNKNINDQASEFSLNLTAHYKGTAFEDKDLKLIVSKLVTTQVPDGFALNLEDTETQADVSKLEKDGKLIFLARFKAKLLPKIDPEKVKNQIKGKSMNEASNLIKEMENVLGSEIKISPSLPPILQRLPILTKNIKVEIGLK